VLDGVLWSCTASVVCRVLVAEAYIRFLCQQRRLARSQYGVYEGQPLRYQGIKRAANTRHGCRMMSSLLAVYLWLAHLSSALLPIREQSSQTPGRRLVGNNRSRQPGNQCPPFMTANSQVFESLCHYVFGFLAFDQAHLIRPLFCHITFVKF
jgi:hypothetical protein